MRARYCFTCLAWCLLLTLTLLGQPDQTKKSEFDPSQRYLVLGTIRTSTMQKELRQAAAAGYRVLAGWLRDEELVMLLEKVTAPPNTYEYLLLATLRSSTMQKEVREAGARGFRLLPHIMLLDTTGAEDGGEMVLVMEKAPASSNRYDYLFLTDGTRFVTIPSTGALDAVSTKRENLRAFPNGYAIVGMMPGRGNVLMAEKPAQPDADVFQNRAEYLLLKTGNGSDLEKELADAGERGFDVVGASHTKDMVILRKAVGQIAESPGGPAELLHPDHARIYASYSGCPKGQKANRPRCTIYIQPMGGWEGYVAAAFSEIVPVVMVSAREDADFEVLGTVRILDPSTARVVGETAAGVIAILTQSGSPVAYPRNLEVTLSVRNTTTGIVMPEHSVRKEIYEEPDVSVELRAWAHKFKEKILESMPIVGTESSVVIGGELAEKGDRPAVVETEPPKAGDMETNVSRQTIPTAKTVAVLGAWGELEAPGTFGQIVTLLGAMSGGGAPSHEADPATAKQIVEKGIRKWGRYNVIEDPTKADLALVVVVRRSRKFGPETRSNELLVFPGGGIPDENSQALWQSGDTKALWGYAASKVTSKFQEYVQELEKKGHD